MKDQNVSYKDYLDYSKGTAVPVLNLTGLHDNPLYSVGDRIIYLNSWVWSKSLRDEPIVFYWANILDVKKSLLGTYCYKVYNDVGGEFEWIDSSIAFISEEDYNNKNNDKEDGGYWGCIGIGNNESDSFMLQYGGNEDFVNIIRDYINDIYWGDENRDEEKDDFRFFGIIEEGAIK